LVRPRGGHGADPMSAPRRRAWLAAAPPYVWLAGFFAFPFVLVAKLSLSHTVLAIPPYAPTLDLSHRAAGLAQFVRGLSGETYARLAADHLYLAAYLNSLKVAAVSSLVLLLLGYPLAYGMARAPQRWRSLLVMAVILPFWTSFLIRIYAWIG